MPPDNGSTWSLARSRELGELEQLVGAAADLGAAEPEVAPVDHQVLADRQFQVERVLLGHDAEAGPDLRAVCPRGPGP